MISELPSTVATAMTEHSCSLSDLLTEADLLCYEHSMRAVLRLRDAADVVYVDEKDLSGIGMSRPEQKRLRAAYQRLFPKGSIMGKLKKKILRKAEAKKIEPHQHDQDQHVIPIERITLCRELGKGEFGSVYQAAWNNGGAGNIQVAVKCVSSEKLLSNPTNFLQEAAIMHKMRHDCVVRLFGVVLDTKAVMLVSELAPCGSLLECLQKPALRESFFVDVLCDFAQQIASGMEYLSSQRLIHRDLAARNVLVFSADKVKISDFGLSRSLGMGEYYYRSEFTESLKLPIAWCAPESINFLKFTSASDVWSYGVTLFEMFSYGQMPWAGLTGAQILSAIDYPRHERLECPDACPSEFYKLMLQCWAHKPEERPSFTDILAQLSDISPQALITVTSCHDGVLDHLQFSKNEVVIVLDKSPSAYPDGYYWRGCVRSGRTGLFRPADTVARLGAENPGGKVDYVTPLLTKITAEKEKEKDKNKKKKLVISEPQGEVRHTCHMGIDGTAFGLLQWDMKDLARALPPPPVLSSPSAQRRSPSVPSASAPPLPSPPLQPHSESPPGCPKPEVMARVACCPGGSPQHMKHAIPPPLPSAPKPHRATPVPTAPPLSEPNSTCNTMTTYLPGLESTDGSLLTDGELLLAVSRTKPGGPPANTVAYIGQPTEEFSWNAENSSELDKILNEMNRDVTDFSLSTSSTIEDFSDDRPLLRRSKVLQLPRPSSANSQPICRVMSAAELEKWEDKVDREHRKVEKALDDERRREISAWRRTSQREHQEKESDRVTKSFSSTIMSSTKAPPDWTEDAQNAYKLLVQCGDDLKSGTPSPTTGCSISKDARTAVVRAESKDVLSSETSRSTSPPEACLSGINKDISVKQSGAVETVSKSDGAARPISPLTSRTSRMSTALRPTLPPVPAKASTVTFADDSSVSPLKQLRNASGAGALNFRARSVQPVEEMNGRLPPPVPPKPKVRAPLSPEEQYPISRGGFASAVAGSALFTGVANDEVIRF